MTSQSEYASLNRWVLSLDLNVATESDCLICGGREFHSLGAEQLKAQAPMVLRRGVGMVSRLSGGCKRGCIRGGGCRGRWGLDGGGLCILGGGFCSGCGIVQEAGEVG